MNAKAFNPALVESGVSFFCGQQNQSSQSGGVLVVILAEKYLWTSAMLVILGIIFNSFPCF